MCLRSTTDNTTGAVCGTDATTGWARGWVIFRDVNGIGDRNYNADASLNDTILRVQDPIAAIGTIPDKSGTATSFQFTASGRMLNASSAATLTFGGSYPVDVQRDVCVSVGGRARVGTTADPC
jgi:Tfp pilus assembly protein FimT